MFCVPFYLEVSRGKLSADDILVLPVDLLAYDTHEGAAQTVIKYFKQVTSYLKTFIGGVVIYKRTNCVQTSLFINFIVP